MIGEENGKGLAKAAHQLRTEVVVRGIDAADGQDFMSTAMTREVTPYGATILLSRVLAPEQELELWRGEREVQVRVIGRIAAEGVFHLYGVAFLESAPEFWGVLFSAEDSRPVAKLLLNCRGCGRAEVLDISGLEEEVFRATGSVPRPCGHCRQVTFWRKPADNPMLSRTAAAGNSAQPQAAASSPGAPAKLSSAPPAPGQETAASAVQRAPAIGEKAAQQADAHEQGAEKNPENRRRHRRVRLDMRACLRSHGKPDDLVHADDVSPGGMRFHSERTYAVGEWLMVSVPYTAAAENIFVQAQVMWRRLASVGGKHAYGIRYTKS